MKRYIVIGYNKKMACTFWLDVEETHEVFYIVNKYFRLKGWGGPHISLPVEIETEAIQVASNNEEVCQFLNIDGEEIDFDRATC